MRYRELHEGRDAPLFHGCSFFAAVEILQLNEMRDRTVHLPRPGTHFRAEVGGVSLSRSALIAKTFGPVVFELDQRLLASRHRLVPFDYWGASNEVKMSDARRKDNFAEAEEFVIGAIPGISRYIRSILVDAAALRRLPHNADAAWLDGKAAVLLRHPLLRVSNRPARD